MADTQPDKERNETSETASEGASDVVSLEEQTNGKRGLDEEGEKSEDIPPFKRTKTEDVGKAEKMEVEDTKVDENPEMTSGEETNEKQVKTEDNEKEKVSEEKTEESKYEKSEADSKLEFKEITEGEKGVDEVKVEISDSDDGNNKAVKVNCEGSDKDDSKNEDDEDHKPLSLVKDLENMDKSDKDSTSSDDSSKENTNPDAPMDLSKGKASEDIIMLSDEEEALTEVRLNGDKESSLDDLELKRKMIKRLQAELRNEEAKLVLLKKLRLSQMSQQMQENIARKTPQPNQHSSQPPPLVRGNQAPVQQAKPAHSQPPQLQRPNGNVPNNNKSQGPPPLVMAPRMDQRQLIQNQMKLLQSQQLAAAAAKAPQQNNLAGFRGTAAQADALRQMQQATQRVEETPAQRQAAAKLALRKQLEKTLLQIPPPKPPPPEMNFIPNLASPDFIYLLGLEEAVNFIIDTNLISKGRKNPDEKMVCNPFTCVQCGTDFTPVWKREKPGSKNVICEQCVTSNQKKALKQEHTNRLKSAFVKALQQEQEIERMQSQEIKTGSVPAPKEKSESRESREASARSAAAQAYKESMAETLRQHQNLVQAHQAAALRMGQPLGLQAFNPRAPFPYQLPFAARASDLQRQYLLDMIPKGGIPWNS